jgi:hypothetical protein
MRYLAIVPFNGGTQIKVCESRTEAYNFIMTAKAMILKEYDVSPKGFVFDLGTAVDVI